MSSSEIRIFADAESVAAAVAEAVIATLASLTAIKPVVNFVLTGGTVGILSLAKLSQLDSSGVQWERVHIWWGDERFVPAGSIDRNDRQAKDAWLGDAGLAASNIHEFPATDSGLSLHDAARAFDEVVDSLAPTFDLVLLGMGPDGHVASLFPGHSENIPGRSIVAEGSSPKPPSERLSFSYAMLNSAERVWLTVAGADKSGAVTDAIENPGCELPVAKVSGTSETIWFVDQAASAELTK